MRYLLWPPITIYPRTLETENKHKATGADLSSYADLSVLFKADGGFAGVFVVKDDGDAGLGDTRLSAFVNQILEILGSDSAHVGDSENKANGIEDV
jgi:hypothetical protein